MDGLEAIEVKLSKTLKNKDFRCDSSFYTTNIFKNSNIKYERIGSHLLKSQYGISVSMNENNKGYPIYRMNEIHDMLCDINVDKTADITKSDLEIFRLNNKDVLFNRTNSFEWVGRTGIYYKSSDKEFVFASYLVRFVPDSKSIKPEYLTAFLNTKYGIKAIRSRARQSINQTNVNPEEVKEIEIPILGVHIQDKIVECFERAYKGILDSKSLYESAKSLLLTCLGFIDYTPINKNISFKTFSNSFAFSGRLDAEYYHPKYDELEGKIFTNAKYLKRVKEIQTENYRGLQPIYSENGTLKVINSKHILEEHLDYDNFEKTDPINWNVQAKARVFKEDILIYTTGANIGRTNIYLSDEKALASNHVNILRIKGENPYYVSFVLNSIIGRMQTEKLSAGSAQQELYPKDIESFLIPFIDANIQDTIKEKVIQSFEFKSKSQKLIEITKAGVEKAIEEGEEIAIDWINMELSKLEEGYKICQE